MSIRTDEEFAGLRRVGRVVARALRALRRALHPGLTTADVSSVDRAGPTGARARTSVASLAFVAALAPTLRAQGGTLGRPPVAQTPERHFIADWSVLQNGLEWQLNVGPNGRYRLWRVESSGDTLVASMGAWRIEVRAAGAGRWADHICLQPVGRDVMCSRIVIDDLGHPDGRRWQFVDVAHPEMSWIAYRDGRAPWQRNRAAVGPVYLMHEVTDRPRLWRCPDPPRFGPEVERPDRVTAELIVEPDSSASDIRVLDAPTAAIREEVTRALGTCRFIPGRLDGRGVRVRVRMPVPLAPRS